MAEVTVRELRNNGGHVLDRVAAGEPVVVTRAGQPVAELRPLSRSSLSAAQLLDRWRHVPRLEAAAFRADVDAALDSSL